MPPVKPVLHPLKTPSSTSLPSELHGDALSSRSDPLRRDGDVSTPITPPAAYTDFLKALTPVFTSPVSAGVSFSKVSFDKSDDLPSSQPASAVSGTFKFQDGLKSATASLPPTTPLAPPPTTRQIAGSPRKIRIPQSVKFSPTTEAAPQSANSIRSPFSPTDWKARYFEAPRSATGKPVSVRQVVTRTVTYKRTHLDAPPKGKRRKCHDSKES